MSYDPINAPIETPALISPTTHNAWAFPSATGERLLLTRGVAEITQDADHAVELSELLSGVIIRSGMSAGRNMALPSAADLIAAIGPYCRAGTSFEFLIYNKNAGAFSVTLTAGANCTLEAGGTFVVAKDTVHRYLAIIMSIAAPGAYTVYSLGAGSAP